MHYLVAYLDKLKLLLWKLKHLSLAKQCIPLAKNVKIHHAHIYTIFETYQFQNCKVTVKLNQTNTKHVSMKEFQKYRSQQNILKVT